MANQLTNYILQQINAGYKVDDIVLFLKSQNYLETQITPAVNEALNLVSANYLSFLDSQVKSGLELSQIRANLVTQGYDSKIIDAAINLYYKTYHKSFIDSAKDIEHKVEQKIEETISTLQKSNVEESPVVANVDQIIKQSISSGFGLENIRSNLMSQGYDPNIVNKEINKYYHSHVHFSKQSLFAIVSIFLVVLLAGGGFFVFQNIDLFSSSSSGNNVKGEARLLDIEVENAFPDLDIGPGGRVNVYVRVSNMGLEKEYDLLLTYQILDSDNTVVARRKSTKALTSSFTDYISIPSDLGAGTYTFDLVADYDGKQDATASFEFVVVAKGSSEGSEVPDTGYEVEPDVDIDTSGESYSSYDDSSLDKSSLRDLQDEIYDLNTYGNSQYLTNEEKEILDEYIADDISYAFYLCRKVQNAAHAGACSYYVATQSGDLNSCNRLSDTAKDKCLLNFVGDTTDDSFCKNMDSAQTTTLCKLLVLQNKNKAISESYGDASYFNKLAELYGSSNSTSTQ